MLPQAQVRLDRGRAPALASSLCHTRCEDDLTPSTDAPTRILALSSTGGGGHVSASNALRDALGNTAEIHRLDPLDDTLSSLDPLRKLTGGRWSGEDFYNLLMRRGWFDVASWLAVSFGRRTFIRNAPAIERLLWPRLDAVRPDVIVSVIPFINAVVLRYARQRRIPFIVLPADFDTSNYVNGFTEESFLTEIGATASPAFAMCLPFEDERIRAAIASAGIPAAQVRVAGFPLRPDFFEAKDRDALRQRFGVPTDRPVVMLLMGAAGSSRAVEYARALTALRGPVHVICCVGRNASLEARIAAIDVPAGITRTIVGFTDRISDLMAIADVLVTKPGPGSIAEAMAMRLPMILDAGSSVLEWERLNLDFVGRRHLGQCASSPDDAARRVSECLAHPERLEAFRKAIAQVPTSDCWETLRLLIPELLTAAHSH